MIILFGNKEAENPMILKTRLNPAIRHVYRKGGVIIGGYHMTTYISLLRGINVSGQKLIKMDALRKSYESLGFYNVTPYLQSGNIIFTGKEAAPDKLAQIISGQIEKEWRRNIPYW